MAKYSLLMKHKAEAPEERQALTLTLYGVAIKWLKALGVQKGDISNDIGGRTTTLFSRLTERDALPFLPLGAAAELTDTGLSILRNAEARGTNDHYNCGYLVGAAEQTLVYADKIKAFQEANPPTPAPEPPVKKAEERLVL